MSDGEHLIRELIWLRQQAMTSPSHWVHSRMAELEGWLAAAHEQAAWDTTRELIARLQTS